MKTKQEANYKDKYNGKQPCKNCDMFRDKRKRCTLVEGSINPHGHCDYWEAKNKLPVAN